VQSSKNGKNIQTSRSLQILVIEDEASVRELLPDMLSGHTVDTASAGEEGLKRFSQDLYDLVISDWSMPGMSGLDVAVEIKRRAPDTVMVLMTGWEVRGTAADYSPAIDFILSKPLELEHVERIVSEADQLRERIRSDSRSV
jgi:DNA-binding NtrC family response regulator